ncbi:hypothetical protein [Arsukibacterium sp.]|uniref:hypothetical protein n=1 Tax=Arsukibacterium sp. TaxID=1977258 RepID=UPI002FDB563F
MKKQTVTIYSILWPHSDAATFAFVEMTDNGCITIGQQQVELVVHDVPADTQVKQTQLRLEQIKKQQLALEAELRALSNE